MWCILGVKRNIPLYMIYGELQRFPVVAYVKIEWLTLVNGSISGFFAMTGVINVSKHPISGLSYNDISSLKAKYVSHLSEKAFIYKYYIYLYDTCQKKKS